MLAPTKCPHFVTGDFKPQNAFLDDKEYGMALDCLVKACTDILLIDEDTKSRVYLGKRVVEPQPDWWTMGGRMRPGETPEQSVARLISRELGLKVDESRLRLIGVHSFVWDKRVQPPAENGTCDLSLVYFLPVAENDVSNIQLDAKEYSSSRWFGLEEVIEGQEFHPALRMRVRQIKSQLAWDRLCLSVNRNDSAESIAEAAKALIGLGI